MERLVAAVTYGADAVYLGGKAFGMRAASANFSPDDLKTAVDFAHKNGVSVYLTCNTLPHNDEVEKLPDFFDAAKAAGVDALIISDIGVLMAAKKHLPDMEIHISTQAGIVNYLTANEFYNMGAKRVVLARELSLDEIKQIRDKTPPELDIEAFVHGAMCVSFSGRCLLSSYLIGRDANRGECAQPCRWSYRLVEEKRPDLYFPIEETQKGTYILNAKDLCMIEHIDKLVEAGITSLKIEGRAKSAYYVSVVANAYRLAVDEYLKNPVTYKTPDWLVTEVQKVSHRQYSNGFFFGR
ncbi:MAG: U32 family peptidase, partial [Oscillospiraceae bacterium]|nr:U32 family peptidase [Oscillospiraceae bacterium]